ncbi:MAG: HAD family hydrolase [Patescibacteria group bacterium]
MKLCIVFDCYQTLVYKKNQEKIVQDFSNSVLKKNIPISYLKRAYSIIYERRKFKHPSFTILQDRKNFYISYNKELFAILGISISSNQALQLNENFNGAKWAVYPDVVSTLIKLKRRKISMGLLSNWTANFQEVIKKLNLREYFNFIYASHDLKIQKPDPKFFTYSLKDILKKHQTIYYVGNDYELDILPARKAGLKTILIDRHNKYPVLADCIRIVKLTDLIKKLEYEIL